jgi:trimethylamine:corrinoid methyltransferase-like protein
LWETIASWNAFCTPTAQPVRSFALDPAEEVKTGLHHVARGEQNAESPADYYCAFAAIFDRGRYIGWREIGRALDVGRLVRIGRVGGEPVAQHKIG